MLAHSLLHCNTLTLQSLVSPIALHVKNKAGQGRRKLAAGAQQACDAEASTCLSRPFNMVIAADVALSIVAALSCSNC